MYTLRDKKSWIKNSRWQYFHAVADPAMEYKKPKSFDTSIINDTLDRLENNPSVIGVMVVGNDGYPIRSTLNNATTIDYLENFGSLVELARYTVKNLDPTDDLNFLRMRTREYEVMIAPEKEYSLIVLQKGDAAIPSRAEDRHT